jgi:HD-GYP domain-containing protein (c-di-GMP phosphodiesterase class II)
LRRPGGPGTDQAKIDKLRHISFFSGLSEYDLHQIDQITTERTYRPGELIVEENTEAERFFIIHKGKIEILKRFEDGEEFVLGVHSDGDFFGEMALLDEGPRSATARALEETSVVEISRQDFEALLYKAPVLAYGIMKELSARLRGTAALLVSHLQRKNRQLMQSYVDTVNALIQAVEARDAYTRGHTERVTRMAKAMGRNMGLTEETLFVVEIASLLHDIGKIGIPDAILLKPAGLTRDEYEIMKSHPTLGARILAGIPGLESVVRVVLHHHEMVDGRGYPDGLAGEDIPLGSRIIAASDTYLSMAEDRPYRPAQTLNAVIQELRRVAGRQLDPNVVDAMLVMIHKETEVFGMPLMGGGEPVRADGPSAPEREAA